MTEDLKAAVSEACAERGLLPWLARSVPDEPGPVVDAVCDALVELHNSGGIDVLDALLVPDPDRGEVPGYLAMVALVRGTVPRLYGDVACVMQAVAAFGTRPLRYVLDEAFLAWCERDQRRAATVLDSFEASEGVGEGFVLAALLAGMRSNLARFLPVALRFATAGEGNTRLLGIRALGLVPVGDHARTDQALSTLAALVRDIRQAPPARATALSSAFDVAVGAPHVSPATLAVLLDGIADEDGQDLLQVCADAFGRHAPKLPEDVLHVLARLLPRLDPDRKGALDMIDIGLYSLLAGEGREAHAIPLLEALITAPRHHAILAALDSTSHALSNGGRERLGRLASRWLLSGRVALCAALKTLMDGVHGWDGALDVALLDGPPSPARALSLAHKAVGWLFFRPTTAASAVVSIIRQSEPADDLEPLRGLLLDPLLTNYPGPVRSHLDTVAPSLPQRAEDAIRRTLAEHDAFLAAVAAVGPVPELHPSEHERRIEHQRQHDIMVAARREAEKTSILRSLVHKSLLLHGTRAISHVRNFDGTYRRLDNKLARLTSEVDVPMQHALDPLGLEAMLMHFRLEPVPS